MIPHFTMSDLIKDFYDNFKIIINIEDKYQHINININIEKYEKFKNNINKYQQKINQNIYLTYKFNKFIKNILTLNILHIINNNNNNYNYEKIIQKINNLIIK